MGKAAVLSPSPHRPPLEPGYGPRWGQGIPEHRSRRIVLPEAGPQGGRYVELHCHSAFSLHEGTSRPEDLIEVAKALGYQGLALTDHNSLAGAMLFAQKARELEMKAIIGAEITLSDDS